MSRHALSSRPRPAPPTANSCGSSYLLVEQLADRPNETGEFTGREQLQSLVLNRSHEPDRPRGRPRPRNQIDRPRTRTTTRRMERFFESAGSETSCVRHGVQGVVTRVSSFCNLYNVPSSAPLVGWHEPLHRPKRCGRRTSISGNSSTASANSWADLVQHCPPVRPGPTPHANFNWPIT